METINSLSIATGIKLTNDTLKQINHITFMYDPNWNLSNADMPSLPACFFHVKSMNEIMTSEISQKPMLFYNSGATNSGVVQESSVLNVVADNIVIKPKAYKLDILVPFSFITPINNSAMFNVNQWMELAVAISGSNTEVTKWLPALNTNNLAFETVKSICKGLLNSEEATFEGKLKGFFSTPDYNKNALETMWRGRKIVKMKLWNSWKYKYLAIVDMDITKQGTDEGYYEATLTVQEVPIMTYRSSSFKQYGIKKGITNKYLEAKGKALIFGLDSLGTTLGNKE